MQVFDLNFARYPTNQKEIDNNNESISKSQRLITKDPLSNILPNSLKGSEEFTVKNNPKNKFIDYHSMPSPNGVSSI